MPSSRDLPAAYDTALTDADAYIKDFPLPLRAPTHYTIRRLYVQNRDEYAPATISSAHASPFGAAYLVGEYVPSDSKEQLKIFQRLWSTIPTSYTLSIKSLRYDYPGYQGGLTTIGSTVGPSGVSMAVDGSGNLVVTNNSHGLSTGQTVVVRWTQNGHAGWQIYFKILSTTTNTFTISTHWVGDTYTSVSYFTVDGYPSRALRNLAVNTRELHEFALPGVTGGITTARDFQALQKMTYLVRADGTETSFLSSATLPSNSEWIASAEAGEFLVADSYIQPYIAGGDILERVTTLVPYLI